jgi:hypothetical protein
VGALAEILNLPEKDWPRCELTEIVAATAGHTTAGDELKLELSDSTELTREA